MNDLQLNLLYIRSRAMGYGRMGVCIAEQMDALGVKVHDQLWPNGRLPSHAAYIEQKKVSPPRGGTSSA